MSDDQSINSLVTGLSNGINRYLGMKIQNDYEAQRDQTNSDRQLQNQKALIDYRQAQQGTINSDTAEQLYPGLGDTVDTFHESNGRYPTVSEFNTLASIHPDAKGANTNQVSTDALTTLLSHAGMSDEDVSSLQDDLKKQGVTSLPVGIAETYMKNSNKGVLPDASLMSLAKDDPTFQAIQDPNQKAEYFNNLKSAFNGGGNASINNQQDLDQVSDAAMKTYQTAMANPDKFGNDPLQATAKVLGKKYNKNAVNKVLLNLTAQKLHNQPSAQPADPNQGGSTIMGAVKHLFMGDSNPTLPPQQPPQNQ